MSNQVTNEEIIKAYLKHKNTKDASIELQISLPRLRSKLYSLRKKGVAIPKYGFSSLTPEEISALNNLIRELQ